MDPRSGIASSHVFTMFPTFVWQVELADAARALIAQQIGGWIDEAVATMPARGESWQSDPRLQGLEPFGDLMRAVDDLHRHRGRDRLPRRLLLTAARAPAHRKSSRGR